MESVPPIMPDTEEELAEMEREIEKEVSLQEHLLQFAINLQESGTLFHILHKLPNPPPIIQSLELLINNKSKRKNLSTVREVNIQLHGIDSQWRAITSYVSDENGPGTIEARSAGDARIVIDTDALSSYCAEFDDIVNEMSERERKRSWDWVWPILAGILMLIVMTYLGFDDYVTNDGTFIR